MRPWSFEIECTHMRGPPSHHFIMQQDPRFHVINHAVGRQALTVLRNKRSSLSEFRDACYQAIPIVLLEATRDLELKTRQIDTPIADGIQGAELAHDIILVPILRAGISMLDAALRLLPFAKVGYFGMQRDEQTAIASTYYEKLPNIEGQDVILLDPMLATGGSAVHALEEIQKRKPRTLSFCCVVCAPEGYQNVRKHFKDVVIWTLAEDEKLDERKFIVPGLGDFGDRYHGTTD